MPSTVQLKQTGVLSLLKKPLLDPREASSYRLISNFSYLSNLTERVVISRLAKYLLSPCSTSVRLSTSIPCERPASFSAERATDSFQGGSSKRRFCVLDLQSNYFIVTTLLSFESGADSSSPSQKVTPESRVPVAAIRVIEV